MMKLYPCFLSAVIIAAACAGEFDTAKAWNKGVFADNILTVKKREFSSAKLTVVPEKTCRFSFEYKTISGGQEGKIRAGFRTFDVKNRVIRPYHVIIRTPSIGEVAEDVSAGSRTIRINGCGQWKKYPHYALAPYAKPDLSDLPNFNAFEGNVESFKKEGNQCIITFKKAIPASIPAGTLIRSHRYGGEFYPWTGKTSSAWQKAEFDLSGIAAKGRDNSITQWNPGTKTAVFIFDCPAGCQIRNIKVQLFDKNKAPAPVAKTAKKALSGRAYEPAEKQMDSSAKITSFYPNGAGGFFLPGEEFSFTASFESPCEGEVVVYDYAGKVLSSERFKAEKKVVTVKVPAPGKNGYFPAVCRAWKGKKLCSEFHAGAIVMPAIAKRDPWFGLNHNGLNRSLREGYKRLGIRTLGISFVTYHIDTLSGGSMDAYLERCAKRTDWITNDKDFECYGAISTAFKGRSVQSHFTKPDPGTKEIARCIEEDFFPVTEPILMRTRELSRRVAEKYKDRITEWHAGEEIDASVKTSPPRGGTSSGTLTAYILMAKQIYRGIKAGNPKAKVDVLGIAGGDWRENPQFPLCKQILKDLGKCFDGVFIDAYSGNWNSVNSPATAPEEGNLQGYLTDSALLSASYGRPCSVVNAERGYAGNYFEAPASANNRQLADYTARSLIIARSTPCTKFIIFKDITVTFPQLAKRRPELADTGFWDCDIWRAVMDEKGGTVPVPKPMCLAVAVAARQLAFTKFSSRLAPGNGVLISVFDRAEGGSLAAVWTSGKPLDMVCTLPKGTVMTDFQGNETAIAGESKLAVSGSPFYLRTSASSAELRKALASADYPVETPAVGEGRITGKGRMLVQIVNRSAQTLSGTLVMPDGTQSKITLKSFALEQFPCPVPAKKGNALFRTGKKEIIIPLDFAEYTIPMLKNTPVFDGSGAWMQNIPAIELKVPDHVTPKRALQWELGLFRNDGTDINVKLYPAWDKENFYIGAVVRDRAHLQRHADSSIWMDDALQFALSTRFDTVKAELMCHPEKNQYGANDFSFGAALTRQGTYIHSWSKVFGGAMPFPGKVTRKNGNTVYEIAVPWAKLKFVPEAGKGIRFSALVMNVDSPEQASAPYHLDFGGGIAGKDDVSLFKTMILGK